MARTAKKQEVTPVVTRAEKKDATKNLIREFLQKQAYKHNDLIDNVAKTYTERYAGEDTENINDVKGRVGSVLDIMKKDGDILFEGGVYALKAEEKPKKATRKAKKKVEETTESKTEETPKKAVKRAKKQSKPVEETRAEEKGEGVPPAPLQPIAPVVPITPDVAPEPIPEKPKKRGRKNKAETTEKPLENKIEEVVEQPQSLAEETVKESTVEQSQEPSKTEPAPTPKAEESPKGTLMDMSFLFGDPKAKLTAKPKTEKAEKKEEVKAVKEEKANETQKEKPVQTKEKTSAPTRKVARESVRKPKAPVGKVLTVDEKLREAFLKRMRQLGGDYFEYYSVYLLEKYSRRNGRRLEGLKITGGDHDGGIDGEIELTDRFGFKETIYIQSKNWNPDKGDEKLWVVGETLVQQFIGACVCRQSKDGKQHCRGIFITTSRFTPEAQRMLDDMSDKVVGYDGNELYETAKECEFGLVKKNGEWVLDEELLSGTKAFFQMK